MKSRIFLVMLLGLALSAPSFAAVGTQAEASQNESATNLSTSSGSSASDLLDHAYFNYFAIYHGAPLNDPTSSRTVGPSGVSTPRSAPINLDSDITAAYLVSRDIGIGADIPFLAVPVKGQGLILGDLGLKAFDRKTLSYRGWNLYTNLILQAPTNAQSQARNMNFALKTTPAVRYTVPRSRFAFGSWTEIKEYAGVTTDKTFKLWAEPYASYQISPTVALNLGYEMEWHHNVGDAPARFSAYQSDLQPGVVWVITPKVLVNPYVQFFTTRQVSLDTAAFGAVISATAL